MTPLEVLALEVIAPALWLHNFPCREKTPIENTPFMECSKRHPACRRQVGWEGMDISDSGQYCTILFHATMFLTVNREDPKILPASAIGVPESSQGDGQLVTLCALLSSVLILNTKVRLKKLVANISCVVLFWFSGPSRCSIDPCQLSLKWPASSVFVFSHVWNRGMNRRGRWTSQLHGSKWSIWLDILGLVLKLSGWKLPSFHN